MFLGQNTYEEGCGVLRACQLYIRLCHAMGIVGLHMCTVVGVYFGIGRWGL